jgi:eukaryotic-like serine/threonine-protein kinase
LGFIVIGRIISHYKILEKIGSGGMGEVYKAEDSKLERIVALKFLPHELTEDDTAKQRFIQEAKAASKLQHNNICTIHEIDETKDGQLFICMDYYEGQTLKDVLENPVGTNHSDKDDKIYHKISGKNASTLPVNKAIEMATQIAQGLTKAHELGIIHRDIKPANIMITNDGVVKILDFGIAKLSDTSHKTKTGSTLGTIAYMSPEQVQGIEVDRQTDIWSLGVVLYEMLTGELPFKGDNDPMIVHSIVFEEPDYSNNTFPSDSKIL